MSQEKDDKEQNDEEIALLEQQKPEIVQGSCLKPQEKQQKKKGDKPNK